MGKQLTAFCLMLILMVQTFNRAVIVTSYFADTAAYAKNCENKAIPQMHCNGKCQMMKKLKQEEKKDKQSPERRNYSDEILSSKSFYAVAVLKADTVIIHNSFFVSNLPEDRISVIFHPPGTYSL